MGKKIILILVLVSVAFVFSGCFKIYHGKEHNRRYWESMKIDLKRLHDEFDMDFFNYSIDDPYKN